ncbi:MAG: class I SAM-dependent methyltransferase [Bacteroidetes bacterium]|nr:class I SAM-dependent methyltransferase [Bacteroidota bacterium]
MDQKRHWNKIAPSYEEEIFDVFRSERHSLIPSIIRKHEKKKGLAIDFGCGTGKAFPMLSPAFGEVLALDISEGVIRTARERNYSNIKFRQADLSDRKVELPMADFLFCCNVIMLPEVEKNRQMFANISRALKQDGHAAVVLPSLESMMFASWRLMDWYRREKVRPEDIPDDEFQYFKSSKRDIVNGIIHIDGVPTKHYSREELEAMLPECGLDVVSIQKLEYGWNTEFADPPVWMQAPYPWDWMVEVRRRKKKAS